VHLDRRATGLAQRRDVGCARDAGALPRQRRTRPAATSPATVFMPTTVKSTSVDTTAAIIVPDP